MCVCLCVCVMCNCSQRGLMCGQLSLGSFQPPTYHWRHQQMLKSYFTAVATISHEDRDVHFFILFFSFFCANLEAVPWDAGGTH